MTKDVQNPAIFLPLTWIWPDTFLSYWGVMQQHNPIFIQLYHARGTERKTHRRATCLTLKLLFLHKQFCMTFYHTSALCSRMIIFVFIQYICVKRVPSRYVIAKGKCKKIIKKEESIRFLQRLFFLSQFNMVTRGIWALNWYPFSLWGSMNLCNE